MTSWSAQKCYWTRQLSRSLHGQHWMGSRHFQSAVLAALGVHNQTPQNLPILLGVPQAAADQSPRKTRRLQLETLSGKFNPRDSLRLHYLPFGQNCWSTQQRSPGPASHRGWELVRAHPPSLPAPTPVFIPVGRDRGEEKGQAGVIPGSNPALSWEYAKT